MSGNLEDIFSFDSHENTINYSNQIENVNLAAENSTELLQPLNYHTTRRIESTRNLLANHSLIAYEAYKTGEPIQIIKAKLFTRLCPSWTPEKESRAFSNDPSGIGYFKEFIIVTPSQTFIEIDNIPNNSSFASSFGGSSSHKTYSPASFKSPDRLKNYKSIRE